jgi:hypothetical protein
MSDDNNEVIEGMRAKRTQRKPPTRRTLETPAVKPTVSTGAQHDNSPKSETKSSEQMPATQTTTEVGPLQVPFDDPPTNWAVRVRRTLDELTSQRLGELRARGVKSSKVELTELLLWELDDSTAHDLEKRLAHFRRNAPR